MLKLEHVTKEYAGRPALQDVSLELPAGQVVGLFGENGAGKTTLMRCILGFVRCTGQITLDGQPLGPHNLARVSYAASSHSFFSNLSPAAHAEFYALHFPAFRPKRFSALMEFFGLPAHRPLRSFSTGQKNQFEVILALCQGADLILMDEPFAGSDLFNREDFYKVLLGLLEPEETVLLSTHLIAEAAGFVDRALLLHQGRLVGDVSMQQLEDQGIGLVELIKQKYDYRGDRVARALDQLTGEE